MQTKAGQGEGQGSGHFAPLDPGRVDMLDAVEVQYWCREFGCTEEELREAVGRTGNHVAAVRQDLHSRR